MSRQLERYARSLLERARSLEIPQDLDERFGPYRDRPVDFVRNILGAEPEPYQVEQLEAAVSGVRRIAIRTGHGVGKSAVLAWLLLWWLLTRPFSRVLILAPAFERQVGRFLLPEVKKWARKAPEPLPVDVRAMGVEVKGYEREWFALGMQASDPDAIEGGHAESLLILADEAKGLDADVVAALHGTQTDVGGDRLYVMASVPGGPSGPFYDAFRSGVWETFHVSAEDSRLVSEGWIEERRQEWGEGSPLFQARVLGEFPEEAEGTLFRLSDLEAAVERAPPELEEGEQPVVRLGVDVARFGDDKSAIAYWRGTELVGVTTKQGLDTMAVAAWVSSEINRRHPKLVRVDEIGIGSGVVDRLRQLEHRVVEGVNVGEGASDSRLFLNLRAEIFWKLRTALERGEVKLPPDDGLLAELSAIRYEFTPKGQIALEKKKETKKRVGHSPDLADAVALGFQEHGEVTAGFWTPSMERPEPEEGSVFYPLGRLGG